MSPSTNTIAAHARRREILKEIGNISINIYSDAVENNAPIHAPICIHSLYIFYVYLIKLQKKNSSDLGSCNCAFKSLLSFFFFFVHITALLSISSRICCLEMKSTYIVSRECIHRVEVYRRGACVYIVEVKWRAWFKSREVREHTHTQRSSSRSAHVFPSRGYIYISKLIDRKQVKASERAYSNSRANMLLLLLGGKLRSVLYIWAFYQTRCATIWCAASRVRARKVNKNMRASRASLSTHDNEPTWFDKNTLERKNWQIDGGI